jgi:nucleotide-binding universal stress UspA family protein
MFEIRDIVAFADGRPQDAGTIECAARLAREHGAHLTGAFVCPFLLTAGGAAYVRGRAIKELLAGYDGEIATLEKARRELFERASRREGLAAEWRAIRQPLTESIVVHARYADLVVAARPVLESPEAPTVVPESLVFASGRPVILLPSEAPPTLGRRIIVGWNASREATRAVADALPLLARAEAVELLIVDPECHSGSHGEEPGADVARHLARHEVRVEVRTVASRGEDIGSVLLSRAAAFGADLLVMGAYGHSRLTELAFGGATRTALHEAELPLFMSR